MANFVTLLVVIRVKHAVCKYLTLTIMTSLKIVLVKQVTHIAIGKTLENHPQDELLFLSTRIYVYIFTHESNTDFFSTCIQKLDIFVTENTASLFAIRPKLFATYLNNTDIKS